jgi:pyruvate formate lyase activating enzyme
VSKPRYIKCELCPRNCVLAENERGNCRSRINYKGELVTLVYGKPCTVHKDPVEKKPMFHFLPGSHAFSIATAGCNLHCKFCQNWEISQINPEDTRNQDLKPEKAVEYARQAGCRSIAYTYSDPVIFYEYTYDASVAARSAGVKNILVTAGFINEKPWRKLCAVTDGANIDIKAMSDDYYRELCGGQLEPVLKACKVASEMGVAVEVTNLIVPTRNDDPEMIRRLCDWTLKNLGPDCPLHFSRFFPFYQMRSLPPTPTETLVQAREIAITQGLHFVYVGNIEIPDGANTFCPGCKKLLVQRQGYSIGEMNIVDGKCRFCGYKIKGVWG